MKTLSGLVLVRETGIGIPNLVVAAFDCEAPLPTSGSRSIRSVLESGRRIGSVLTDKDGRFTLRSEELEFQGNESRPDLSLVVFAPEDVLRVDEPYPDPVERRVLYVSAAPRVDAGADEAFVIRLLQAQLDRFRIPAGATARHGLYDSERLASVVDGGWKFRDALKERLRSRTAQEHEKNTRFREAALEKVRNLSAIPMHLRDENMRSNRLLIRERSQLADSVRALQEQSVSEGLARMEDRSPALRLMLTDQDLADLGLRAKGTELSGSVDPQALAAKVRSLVKGVDLVRVRGLEPPSPELLEQKYLSGGSAGTPGTPSRPVKGG